MWRQLYSTITIRMFLGTIIGLWGLSTAVRGQTLPNVEITFPNDGDSLTVGPASSQLEVGFRTHNGFDFTSAKLSFIDEDGGLVNYSINDMVPQYDPDTQSFVVKLRVPPGTTTNAKVVVRAYRSANSSGDPAMNASDSVENLTITKQP